MLTRAPRRGPGLVLLAVLVALPGMLHAEESPGQVAAPVHAPLRAVAERAADTPSRRIALGLEAPVGTRAPQESTALLFGPLACRDARGRKIVVALDAEPPGRLGLVGQEDGQVLWRPFGTLRRASEDVREQELTLPLVLDSAHGPQEIEVRFVLRRGASGWIELRYALHHHRRGAVVLCGRLRPVVLLDADQDGRFDGAGDALLLDVDGNGRADAEAWRHERFAAGASIRIREAGWRYLGLSEEGRSLAFAPLDTPPPAPARAWPPVVSPPAGVMPPRSEHALASLEAQFRRALDWRAEHRVPTVREIGRHRTPRAFEVLMRIAMEDPVVRVRAAAVEAMGNPAFAEVGARRLAAFMRSRLHPLRLAACHALHDMGHPTRSALYRVRLQDNLLPVVGAAARYLVAAEGRRVGPQLLSALSETDDPARMETIYREGLRRLPDGPPPATMLRLLREGGPSLQRAVLEDLGRIGHRAAEEHALRRAETAVLHREEFPIVLAILAQRADRAATQRLVELGARPWLQGEQRQALEHELGWLRGGGARSALETALTHEHASVRRLAADTLGRLANAGTTHALLDRIAREPNDEVKAALIRSLGAIEDPAGIAPLIEIAQSRHHPLRSLAVRSLGRLGFEYVAVRDFFLGLLESEDAEDRALGIRAAAASGRRELWPRIAPALQHPGWQVRLGAIDAADALRVPSAIRRLIDRLAVEPHARLRHRMGDVLYRLTGALLYEDPAMWQRWWREHGEHFELAPTAPPAPGHGRGGTEAAFYGIGVRSNRVCFVIDQSGSMGSAAGPRAKGKTRFDVARDQVNHALRAFGAEDRANLMLFTSDPRPWRGGLQPMTRSNRRRLTSFLRARRPEGGTNLYDAVARALVQPNVDTLFVLSDGQPVQGSYVKPEDILREIRRLNVTRRVAIHCIAVGHDSPLLRQLAAENEGQYVRH